MLEKVANVVKDKTSIFACKPALSEVFGDKNVYYETTMNGCFITIKSNNKKVLVASKKMVDYTSKDIVCGNLVVGFID